MHLAVGLLSSAFQFMTKKERKAPIIAIKEVEAPTDKSYAMREENRMPPIPPRTQIYIIFNGFTIDSNIVPNIKANMEFENM